MTDDAEELRERWNAILEAIDEEDREPTPEEEEEMEELLVAIEEIESFGEDVEDDDYEERKDRLLAGDPVTLSDGEEDTWERWREDLGSPGRWSI